MATASPLSGESYPPMSHPVADPSVNAVAARFAGLEPPDPATSRIIDIGCATGHHLLPLSMRWPQARFTGIDTCEDAIRQARALASLSGLSERVDFQCASLSGFDQGAGPYDYIIAHGFFSWVPDSVKQQLLDFCSRNLTKNGIAVVSFNVTTGWQPRLSLVRKARALVASGLVDDEIAALQAMETALSDASETTTIRDMLAKGRQILRFDEFGSVNDPWPLGAFVSAAAKAGLHWLGESRVSDNQPRTWEAEDEQERERLRRELNPVALHQWMDERSQRTFRSALLCRVDAPALNNPDMDAIRRIALRPATPTPPETIGDLARRIHECLMHAWPSAPWASVVFEQLASDNPRDIMAEIRRGLANGSLLGRSEPVVIPDQPPAIPTFDPLRLTCARLDLPVVDAWHLPCVFPEHQRPLLAAFDGTRSMKDIRRLAAETSPRLDFNRWVADLNQRGMFSPVPI